MSWRFTGRAKVNAKAPQAMAVCQRCGFWYNHVNLQWQMEWRGNKLQNIRLLVCRRCLDKPFIFNKSVVLPPDPLPIEFPLPENFAAANAGTNPLPPLPWPVQPVGPAIVPIFLTDDNGNILTDDNGYPLLADGSPLPPPPAPVYTTPPLPPLPPNIESEP